ncbi:nuclear transport factor 2 family protein [Alcanivorax sp. 1008]|uniref:nuclear transport factor 2 family protein n=1 Tax=Alcanivorax sp. 1008 TaxID=2816853 RepID=UPI001D9D665A|nr:nuclear transport factor 2 family protein [Alcanivorax sp. 1008]MCC1495463.1 nuclear transport factor 2 family protein [Alcanivorax sp. 1008]
MKQFAALFLLSLASMLAGCASHKAISYVDSYEEALIRFPGSPVSSRQVAEGFSSLYASLKGPDLARRVDEVYAEDLFFGDTLHTYHSREELRDYLLLTAERVENIEVDVRHVLVDGNDVWLNWGMKTSAKALGRTMHAETIGMTHLRFNSRGQVVLHQDYWDSSEGVLIHIPFIGGLVRWTRNQL